MSAADVRQGREKNYSTRDLAYGLRRMADVGIVHHGNNATLLRAAADMLENEGS